MMSAEGIIHLQQQATRQAARARREPITVFSVENAERDLRTCPNLGTHLAKGWKRVLDFHGKQPETYFESVCEVIVESLTSKALGGSRVYAAHHVPEDLRLFIDKGGFGESDEPALTLEEAVECIENAQRAVEGLKHGKFALGLGIVEEGPFQAYVGVFIREITVTAADRKARAGWRKRQTGEVELPDTDPCNGDETQGLGSDFGTGNE